MSKNQGIIGFINHLIPVSMRHSLDLEMRIRTHVTIGLLLTNLVVAFVILAIQVGASLLGASVHNGLVASGGAVFLMLAQWALFYYLGKINLSGILFAATYLLGTSVAVFITGGWHSPIMLLLFCSPAITYLLCGRKIGIVVVVVVFIYSIALAFMQRGNYEFIQLIQPQNFGLIKLSIWFVSLILLVSCLLIYDSLIDRFSR